MFALSRTHAGSRTRLGNWAIENEGNILPYSRRPGSRAPAAARVRAARRSASASSSSQYVTVGGDDSIALIHRELKARAGQTVRVTLSRGGRALKDVYYSLPSEDRFNSEFRGSIGYTWMNEASSKGGDTIYERGDVITISPSSPVEAEATTQTFRRDSDNQCLLRPIHDDMVERSKGTTRTHQNWRSRARKIEVEMERHPDGVPDSELAEIAERHKIKIEVVAPLQDSDDDKHIFACSTQRPFASYKFINCSMNHVERVAQMGNVTEATREQLQAMYDDFVRERSIFEARAPPFFAFKKDKQGINQILTSNGSFISKSKFMDEVQNFEKSTGLANTKLCHITQPALSKFIERGLFWNCATFVVKGRGEAPPDLKIIDLASSYASFKTCSAYAGFPAKITDHRATDRVHGPGFYTIVDLDFSKCCSKFVEALELAGSPYQDNNVYPSPELAFLSSNGVRYRVVEGAWSDASQNMLDFVFPGKKEDDTGMYSKVETGERFYAVYTGACAHRSDSSSFYMHGSKRFFSTMKARLGDRVIRHFSDGIGSVAYPRKRAYYLPQVPAYINAYERIRMFEQLIKMDLSKVHALQKDGIVFEEHEFEIDSCFRRKDDIFQNANPCDVYVHGVYPSDFFEVPSAPSREIVDSPVTLAIGGGGCGKTTHYLKDDGLITPIFISPSWKLARSKQAEHGVACDVLANLMSGDPEKLRSIYTQHSVLIVDECSMIPLSVAESIVRAFSMHKIIFCGDLGEDCVYQLPPVHCAPDNYPTTRRFKDSDELGRAHVETFSKNHRCKCPRLLQILEELRSFIDGTHPCVSDTDSDAIRMRKTLKYFTKAFEREGRVVSRKDAVDAYKIEDMILVSRRDMRDEYNEAVSEKSSKIDGPVLKKWHVLANTRAFQNGQLVISETAPDVKCEESNAHTVHLCQGETCTENLFIDTRKLFEPQHLYTAISRGQRLSNIWLISEADDGVQDAAYARTKIYSIVSEEGKLCYIGHTTKELRERLKGHILDGKCMSRMVLEFEDAEIKMLEEYPCANRKEAVERERYWIARTPGCVNKNDLPRDPVTGGAVPSPAVACASLKIL